MLSKSVEIRERDIFKFVKLGLYQWNLGVQSVLNQMKFGSAKSLSLHCLSYIVLIFSNLLVLDCRLMQLIQRAGTRESLRQSLLKSRGVNWTSLRPVYIYGPLNYNHVEEWFFHRLKAGRPIPVPNSGIQITQLGHVKVR